MTDMVELLNLAENEKEVNRKLQKRQCFLQDLAQRIADEEGDFRRWWSYMPAVPYPLDLFDRFYTAKYLTEIYENQGVDLEELLSDVPGDTVVHKAEHLLKKQRV